MCEREFVRTPVFVRQMCNISTNSDYIYNSHIENNLYKGYISFLLLYNKPPQNLLT